MKLATYKDGSRDGQLLVVSRDLALAHFATGIADRLQQVLDDWNYLAPQLQDLSIMLNHGKARHAFPFDPRLCMAPLPRAYQWVHRTACDHRVASAHGALPSDAPTALLHLHQGSGDSFIGPCDPVALPSEEDGMDFEPGIAVITGDLPLGVSPEQALDGIRLLMLANSVRLRHRMAAEWAQGSGCVQSQPATAFSPVAVTPDELGPAWQDGQVQLALQCAWNGHPVSLSGARLDAGSDGAPHLGQLIAYIAQTRRVRAGSVVGSGALRHAGEAADGQPGSAGLRDGDTLRIEMKGPDGASVFGTLDQTVVPSAPGA